MVMSMGYKYTEVWIYRPRGIIFVEPIYDKLDKLIRLKEKRILHLFSGKSRIGDTCDINAYFKPNTSLIAPINCLSIMKATMLCLQSLLTTQDTITGSNLTHSLKRHQEFSRSGGFWLYFIHCVTSSLKEWKDML